MPVTIEIKLKPETIAEIRKNKDLKNRLIFELGISPSTLARLLDGNSDRLTTATALKIIGDELGRTNDELLTQEA